MSFDRLAAVGDLEFRSFLALGVVTVLVLAYAVSNAHKLPLPPGPPGKLFVGNALEVPKSEYWKGYAAWSRTYGPVIYFRIFGREVVVLNTADSVVDLLEKRSSIYSDRPVLWMYHMLADRKLAVFHVSSENERFKKYRKLMNSGLNARATTSYREVMENEARTLLQGLSKTPENFARHIRRQAAGVILKVAYGYSVTGVDDYFVQVAEEGSTVSAQASQPGRWLVDSFNFLRFVPAWFPGGGFKRRGKQFRLDLQRLDQVPHDWVKEQIAKGDYVDSFSSRLLKPENGNILTTEEESIARWVSGGLYAGGADTTVSAMTSFFFVMTLFPEVQKRAQAEIDRIVGSGRLPTFEDQKEAVFVTALIKEILRWAPVAPLGLPHRLTKDDEYNGCRIPRGAVVIANIWALMHDETVYPNPMKFDPDRFVQRDGHTTQADPTVYAFGFGRRVCPGAHFARTSLFLNIAHVLATFDICKARDAAGQEIEPELAFSSGITSHVQPFKCQITPRSPETLALLES